MPQIRIAPPLLLAAAFTCATRWPLDAQTPVRSDAGAAALVENAAPSTARGMLLPGSGDLARLRFESSTINFHVVADRNSKGDSVRGDFGRTQKDYVPTSYHGAPAIMIVLSQLGGRQPFVDSALVRRDGLAPIWEVQHLGRKRTRYDYDGAIVRREVTTPDSSAAQSTTTYPFRVFNFNELDEVVRSVPLRPGYRAIVPLYSEGDNALETDSVDVEGTDSSGVWNVRFADKVIIGHYGIDGATRRIVRYEVNRHADKAHFCYLFGSDSTRTCPARRAAGQARVSRSNAELPRWLTLPEAPPMPRPDTSEIVAASGGARLYAAIFHRGGASPVLLLHGGLENSDVWSSEVARLSPSHEVIVIDTRGHGRSTLGDIPLSYALFAEDAIAVLDSLHIPSVVVVGTSDGGITGLRLAIDDPQRIDGLLTYGANFDSTGNPSAPPDSAMDALGRLYVGHAKTDYERVSPTPGNFPKLEIALGKLYAREPAISHAALRSIRAPTTIVDGDHEQFVTRAHTGQLAALIPGAHLVVMPGVSHDGPVQDPDGFHRIVTQFLAAARHGSHASVRQEFEGAVGCAAR